MADGDYCRIFEGLQKRPFDLVDETYYVKSELEAVSTKVIELVPDTGWLFIRERPGEVLIDFAVMTFAVADENNEVYLTELWIGTGISDALRELRHSWFGDRDRSGYVYYISMRVLSAACAALQQYFDLD